MWRYFSEDRVSDYFGLAADETMALRVGENQSLPILRLYTYRSNGALVGRFQRIENELNLNFCETQGISVNRRPTGGGAILMVRINLELPGCSENGKAARPPVN